MSSTLSVKFITKIHSTCIAVLLLFISTFIFLAWQEMDKPNQINQSYHAIKTEIETDIVLSLEQYLGSGDAGKLLQAENQLNQLKACSIDWFSLTQKDILSVLVENLFLFSKYFHYYTAMLDENHAPSSVKCFSSW